MPTFRSEGPYILGAESFWSKDAILRRARGIKDRCRGGPVEGVDDIDFLNCLVRWHPDAAAKIGMGITGFVVLRDVERGTDSWHFEIIRVDGTRAGFSYRRCVYGRQTTAEKVNSALRMAIAPQVAAFKLANLVPGMTCPLTGEAITLDNCHVDHVAPRTYVWLRDQWLAGQGIKLEDVPVFEAVPVEGIWELSDMEQQASWGEFHRQNCDLRLLSVRGNCSVARREV